MNIPSVGRMTAKYQELELLTKPGQAHLEYINEGGGARNTERFVGVHRDTVTRYGRLAGERASKAYDELMAFPRSNKEVRFEVEKWPLVAEKERRCVRCDPMDEHKGEC